jgi:hypothetical protein
MERRRRRRRRRTLRRARAPVTYLQLSATWADTHIKGNDVHGISLERRHVKHTNERRVWPGESIEGGSGARARGSTDSTREAVWGCIYEARCDCECESRERV